MRYVFCAQYEVLETQYSVLSVLYYVLCPPCLIQSTVAMVINGPGVYSRNPVR